jgi:predicted GIY-YIG superfamily endonuclease
LVFYEAFVQKADATREEKFLKTDKGRERRKYLLAEFEKMNVDK